MRYCSSCGHPNSEEARRCTSCAVALGHACPACGQWMSVEARFCSSCGQRLTESAALGNRQSNSDAGEYVAEQRVVTVLFADVTNFTAYAYQLGTEEIYVQMDEALRLLARAVQKYDGTVDKFIGDGLMALFGAPVTHEDDPERAVRAALEMQSALQPLQSRIRQQHGFEFQLRIGLHSGPVIAGTVGSDAQSAYTVTGHTANLASRLEAAAEPGTILVSQATQHLTRALFHYQPLPPLTVKGLPEPVQAYRLLGPRELPSRTRGIPWLRPPMVGRHQELACLQEAAQRIESGEAPTVLLTGEAGLGKSRLLAEFREWAAQKKLALYQGSCLAYTQATPLSVVAALLRDVLSLSESDPPSTQLATLHHSMQQQNLRTAALAPYLVHTLGLVRESPSFLDTLRRLDAATLQRQTHIALRQFLVALARTQPTVLIFEDLHWVDPASRDFLEYLLGTLDGVPLMLILVSRDIEQEGRILPLVRTATQQPDRLLALPLSALSPADQSLLLDHLLTDGSPDARRLKQRLAERAAGNPFYTEELLRALLDEGALAYHAESATWELTPHLEEGLKAIPDSLQGIFLARFDRLEAGLKRTLQLAAVVGRTLPVRLLEAVRTLSPEEVGTHLSELVTQNFLVAEPSQALPGYTFRHALIRESLYGTLLRRDRLRLHGLVAQAIEAQSLWPPEEQAEALAYHYRHSTEPQRALPWLMAAATHAAHRYANEAAALHYRHILAILKDNPSVSREERAPVLLGLGQALKFSGELGEARTIFQTLLHALPAQPHDEALLQLRVETLKELGDAHLRAGALDEALASLQSARTLLGDRGAKEHPHLWRTVLDRMAWALLRQGKPEEVSALAEAAQFDRASALEEDPITLASLFNALGGSHWQRGNLQVAIYYVERSLALYEKEEFLHGVASARNNLGVLHAYLGEWPKAVENFEQADSLRQQIGDVQHRAHNLDHLGTLRLSMGDHEAAQRDFEASLAIRQRLGDTFGSAHSYFSLAQLALVREQWEAASQHARRALDLSHASGSHETEVQALWVLALAEAEQGNAEQGQREAERALELAHQFGLTEKEADCLRALGILHTRAHSFAEAEQVLTASVSLCRQHNEPYRLGLALLELGRLHLTRQRAARSGNPTRTEQARKPLTEAIHLFETLGARHDLRLAQETTAALAPAPTVGQ